MWGEGGREEGFEASRNINTHAENGTLQE